MTCKWFVSGWQIEFDFEFERAVELSFSSPFQPTLTHRMELESGTLRGILAIWGESRIIMMIMIMPHPDVISLPAKV